MRINDLLLESTHPLYESVLPTYHPAVRLGEDLARSLMEAQLTAQQVQALFTQVQQQVDAGGGNRTIAGKGVDAAKKLKAIYDYAKKVTQDSGPVKGFDGAFEKLAAELKEKSGGDTGAMRYVQKYRDFAKAHPMAQKAVYATLVLAVGVAGYVGMGPAFLVLKPAIVGIMKFTDKLLQGEKFSSAAIAGAETFAIADIAQSIGAGLKSLMGGQVPTSVPKPIGGGAAADAAPSGGQPTGATAAADAGEKPSVAAAKRAAAMQAVSDKASAAPTNPAATPVAKPFAGPGTFDPTTKQWKPYVSPTAAPAVNPADISPEDLKKGNFPGPKTYDVKTQQWKPLTSPTATPATPDAAPATTPEPTKAAGPRKDFSLAANAIGGDVLDAVNDDPKAKRVIDYLTKDLNTKFSQVAQGKLGSDVLQNIQKDLLKQVNSLYPDDAELFLTAQQKKELVYQLMAKAQDSFVESSPRLFKIVGDVTNNLFDKISSGNIKTEIELDKFLRNQIINQNPELKNSPAVISILHRKADSMLQSIYSDALDADPKFSKDPEWKIKAIQQWLSKKESINFDRPALTEAQVMEAFRGTMFAPTLLTEAQVKHLFQKLEEGPIWDKIKSAGGAVAGAAVKGATAAAGSKLGQAAIKGATAAGQKIATGAGNLTNKVTADKLMSAWKKAGSPTDSTAVYEFLKTQGIDENMLKSAFKAAKIPVGRIKKATTKPGAVGNTPAGTTGAATPSAPKTATTGTTASGVPAISAQYSAALAQIQKLPAPEKQKAIKYIQTKLATA